MDWILETLESVSHQEYKEWECILVDNGSKDGTVEVINKYIDTHPGNWKLMKMAENGGPSGARSAGFLAARGDFIALLDGDDLWCTNKLATQLRYMQANMDVSMSLTSYLIFSRNSRRVRFISSKSIDSLIHGWLSMASFGGLVESTGMLRKSDLNDELLFDKSYMGSEGLDFVIRWNSHHKVSIMQEPLTYYRISENQLHENEAAIKENVKRLTASLDSSESYKSKVLRSQNAYFYLSAIARGGLSIHKVLGFINPHETVSRITMLAHLVFRNLASTLKGFKYTHPQNL